MNSNRSFALLAVFASACGSPSLGSPSNVNINQTAPSEPTGAITGTVSTPRGDALPGLAVHLVDANVVANTTTDANGAFHFYDVPAGAAAVVTITGSPAYTDATFNVTIPDAVGTSSTTNAADTPLKNSSVAIDATLLQLDGSYSLRVVGTPSGTAALPALPGLDVVGAVATPNGQGPFLFTGTYAAAGAIANNVLGTITFANAPDPLDLTILFGTGGNATTAVTVYAAEPASVAAPDYEPRQQPLTVAQLVGGTNPTAPNAAPPTVTINEIVH